MVLDFLDDTVNGDGVEDFFSAWRHYRSWSQGHALIYLEWSVVGRRDDGWEYGHRIGVVLVTFGPARRSDEVCLIYRGGVI
jgi:hypothetical protein